MVKAAALQDTNGCSGHLTDRSAASLTPITRSLSATLDGYLAGTNTITNTNTNGCSRHFTARSEASLTPSTRSLSQHESAMLDGYLAVMADGRLDPLCSYIDGVAACLPLSPGGKEPGPMGECDSAAASLAGCDAWLREIVEEVEQQHECSGAEEAQGTGNGQEATGIEDEQKEEAPGPAQNTGGGQQATGTEDEEKEQAARPARNTGGRQQAEGRDEDEQEEQAPGAPRNIGVERQAEGRDEDEQKEQLLGKGRMEAVGDRMEDGKINEEVTQPGSDTKEKLEDDKQTEAIKEYILVDTAQGGRKGHGRLMEAPARMGCADKENVDPCLVGARGARSSLLPHSSLGTAAVGLPLTKGAEERRQLRPRTRRRQYYEDDDISKDDDYLCECENPVPPSTKLRESKILLQCPRATHLTLHHSKSGDLSKCPLL